MFKTLWNTVKKGLISCFQVYKHAYAVEREFYKVQNSKLVPYLVLTYTKAGALSCDVPVYVCDKLVGAVTKKLVLGTAIILKAPKVWTGDCKIAVYIDEHVAQHFTEKAKTAVFAHEIGHIVMDHLTVRRKVISTAWTRARQEALSNLVIQQELEADDFAVSLNCGEELYFFLQRVQTDLEALPLTDDVCNLRQQIAIRLSNLRFSTRLGDSIEEDLRKLNEVVAEIAA
jgi:hypothetical protein